MQIVQWGLGKPHLWSITQILLLVLSPFSCFPHVSVTSSRFPLSCLSASWGSDIVKHNCIPKGFSCITSYRFICSFIWVYPQMFFSDQGWARTCPVLPHAWQGSKYLSHHLLMTQKHEQGAALEAKQQRRKLVCQHWLSALQVPTPCATFNQDKLPRLFPPCLLSMSNYSFSTSVLQNIVQNGTYNTEFCGTLQTKHLVILIPIISIALRFLIWHCLLVMPLLQDSASTRVPILPKFWVLATCVALGIMWGVN